MFVGILRYTTNQKCFTNFVSRYKGDTVKDYIIKGGKKMAALFKMLVTEVLVVQPACPNGTCCSYVVAGGGIGSIT